MRRREVIACLGAAALWPFAAQQPSRMKRVAVVHPATKPADMRIGGDPNYAILFEEMQRLGYVEGVNMIVDRYSAEGRFDRYRELARDVVAKRPDVIFPITAPLTLALLADFTHCLHEAMRKQHFNDISMTIGARHRQFMKPYRTETAYSVMDSRDFHL